MTRRRLRDVPALAWLMAREFARPGREVRSGPWLAAGMLPVFVMASMDAGVYHWDRLAVVTVHRTGLRLWVHRFGLVVALVAALSILYFIADSNGISAYFWGLVGVLLGFVAIAFVAAHRAAVRHARTKAHETPVVVRVEGPEGPPATWDISMAATTPGMNAIPRLYAPEVRRRVPSRCTVSATPRNDYLAGVYALEGFQFRPGPKRKMHLTLP